MSSLQKVPGSAAKESVVVYDPEIHELAFECLGRSNQHSLPTNAQKHLWDIVSSYGDGAPHLNLATSIDVARGHHLKHVLNCIRWLVERHASLRTYYMSTGESDLRQGLSMQGVIPVSVFATREDDLASVASAVTSNLRALPFDMSSKLLLRCAVVAVDDDPRKIIFVFCRLNVDGWSKAIINDEVSKALEYRLQEIPSLPGRSPIEQAAWERSGAGIEERGIIMDHWRHQLQIFPRAMFIKSSLSIEKQRWWKGEIRSTRLEESLRTLAVTYKVSFATILSSAFALFFAYMNRVEFCAVSAVVANHFDPDLIFSVGNFPQNTPIFLPLQGSSFQAITKETEGEALQAYTCGSYWPPDVAAEIEKAGAQRGIRIELDIVLNFGAQVGKRQATQDHSSPPSSTEGPAFRWISSSSVDHNRFYVESFDPSVVVLTADTNFISKVDIRKVLHGVENLICRVAEGFQGSPWDLVRESRVGRLEPSASWVVVDHCWVDLQAVSDCICRSGRVHACSVFPLPRQAGESGLIAYFVADSMVSSVSDMFLSIREEIFLDRTTMLPKRYVRCDAAPTVSRSEQSWKRCGIIEEGVVF